MKSRKENGYIYLRFPYNESFSSELKKYCGAKWKAESKEWFFSEEFEEKANDLMLRRYGYSLRESPKLIIEFSANEFYNPDTLCVSIEGYTFVYRERDYMDVSLKRNTVILKGGFPIKGGSSRYPCAKPFEDTTLRSEITQEFWDMLSDDTRKKLKRIDSKSEEDVLLERKKQILAELEEINKKLENIKTQKKEKKDEENN
jgi:hypothetical protein